MFRRSTFVAGALIAVCSGLSAQASFHVMQVHQVIGGVNGDATAQAIQLRMRQAGQSIVSASRIKIRDAAGNNPITLLDITSNVGNDDAGSTILIASANFANYTDIPLDADFTLTTLIPESHLAAGSLTFESDGGIIYWRVSWGGAGYTGSGSGNTINDPDGNFNPAFGAACPSSGVSSLLFDGAFGDLSTNNAADYIVTSGAAVLTNNDGVSFTVTIPPSDSDGDGVNDDVDNCPDEANPGQEDCDGDGQGDLCAISSGRSSDNNDNGIPDECEPPAPCDGDTNGDGTVDPLDSGFVQARFGCAVGTGDPGCDAADANLDGLVDPLDAGYVQARFGPCDE